MTTSPWCIFLPVALPGVERDFSPEALHIVTDTGKADFPPAVPNGGTTALSLKTE